MMSWMLLAQVGLTAETNDFVVVPYNEISRMTPVDRGGTVYVQLDVVHAVGDRPEARRQDAIGGRPRLQLAFPKRFKTITVGAGLWSCTNKTILIQLVGGNEAKAREEMIEQWKVANKPSEHD